MKIQNSVALVTGANRGLGKVFAQKLLEGGARKVYAGARDPAKIAIPGVVPIKLDITSEADVRAAVAACGDVTLLINNAGIAASVPLIGGEIAEQAHREMETNYFGTWRVSSAFCADPRQERRWRAHQYPLRAELDHDRPVWVL